MALKRGPQYFKAKKRKKRTFNQESRCVVCGVRVDKNALYGHNGLGLFFELPRKGYRYCKRSEVINVDNVTSIQLDKIERNTKWTRK